MKKSPENLQLETLVALEDDYIKIGNDPGNRKLLIEEIERLRNYRKPNGQIMFKDESQIRRLAALDTGIAASRSKHPETV